MKNIFIIGFVLMIAAQWYAPLSMIIDAQDTINNGTIYKFRTRPVDPSDPFRGKYITLDFDAETYRADSSIRMDSFENNQQAYAIIVQPGDFAKITELRSERPTEAVTYMEVKVLYSYPDESMVALEFPFKRFYLEESKASEAEQLYWSTRSDSTMNCYATVKVLDGDTKIVDVMVNDSSIVDVVRRINAGKEK